MGEYWKPVNVTRKEYVRAHRVDEGLKLSEWTWPGSRVMAIVATWGPTDDIRIVSDYYGDIRVTDAAKGSAIEASYDLCEEDPSWVSIESTCGRDPQNTDTVRAVIRAVKEW